MRSSDKSTNTEVSPETMEVLRSTEAAYDNAYTAGGVPRTLSGCSLLPSEHRALGEAAAWHGFNQYMVWAHTKDLRRRYMTIQQQDAAKEALYIITFKSIIDLVQARRGDGLDIER